VSFGKLRSAQETLDHIVPRNLRENVADGKGCEGKYALCARDGAKEVLAT
jgi:hypothetical protein